MKCPTALKILKELNSCEKRDVVFNGFGNPDKKAEVRKALEELKQAINSHEKLIKIKQISYEAICTGDQEASDKAIGLIEDFDNEN